MKKLLFALLTILAISCGEKNSKTQNGGYTLNGYLTNFKDSTLLVLRDWKKNKAIDSSYVIDGKVMFSGKVDNPGRYVLQTKFNPSDRNSFKNTTFWIENMPMELRGDYNDFRNSTISGSPIQEINQKLSSKKLIYDKERDSLVKLLIGGAKNRDELGQRMRVLDSITNSIDMEFMRTSPNNHVALELMTFFNDKFPKEELKTIYDSLDENLKNSENGMVIKQYLSIEKILEKDDIFAEIKGSTLSGEEVSLTNVVKDNKLTILDFWAAGCGPCRMQSKQYLEIYEEYHPKGLEIVSFSIDSNKEFWEKASKEDSISWVNISNLSGFNSKEAMTYGVKGIPNCFLINQEGIIIAELNGYYKNKMPFLNHLEKL